jgi:hypothetical protein
MSNNGSQNDFETDDKVVIEGRRAKVKFSWKLNRDSEKKEQVTVFDFSDVSEDDLIKIALYWCKMKVQNLLRDMASANGYVDDLALQEVDVLRDLINTGRGAKSEVDKAIAAMRKANVAPEIIQQVINSRYKS